MNEDQQRKFIDFYQRQADALFRFVYIRVSERELALDMVQEAFLRCLEAWQKGKVAHQRAYLFSIARNLVIDWYRKKKALSLESLSENQEEDGPRFDLPDESAPDPEILASGRYALEKINQLPESLKEVAYLRFVESLAPQEIAEILGETANNVSVKINRSVNALRQILGIAPVGQTDKNKK